jgi:O-methyltransferase involved in polyketide biosynthesis
MENSAIESAKISPTAHYTGYIWVKNGLSDERLRTKQGVILFKLLQPLMKFSSLRNGPTLEDFLIARHQLIDYHLEAAIESGSITQIIEIAAGLSPRGLRFAKKYGSKITYIEADLESMSKCKKQLIGDSIDSVHHQIVTIDALAQSGPNSLSELVEKLLKQNGLAIVTEGLVNYFDESNARIIWKNFSQALSQFPTGLYLSDIHLGKQNKGRTARIFSRMLSIFVRGGVYLHFKTREDAEKALIECGFKFAKLHKPSDWADKIKACSKKGANLVRVIEARI